MKKLIFILFISLISVSSAEEVYFILKGSCTKNTSYRDQFGRYVERDLTHSYISYPFKIDTEDYTEAMLKTTFERQIRKKHNNFTLKTVYLQRFESKTEAKAKYKEMQKNKEGFRLSFSTTELNKVKKEMK